MDERARESVLYIAVTESQARRIAAFEHAAIIEVVVDCCRFAIDCEWGGLQKYAGSPEAETPKKRKRA